jgi:hypothetical protein
VLAGKQKKQAASISGSLFFVMRCKIRLEGDPFFHHHFTKVDQTIAHTAKRRIDTAVCQGSDLLETQVGIVPQDDDFTLILRKKVQHPSYTVVALPFHDFDVSAVFRKINDFENVPVITGFDGGRSFHLAEMIYAKVVRDTHGPGKEFTFFCIPPTSDGVDNLNQNILENVLSQILVFDEEENGSVQFVLVADYECL